MIASNDNKGHPTLAAIWYGATVMILDNRGCNFELVKAVVTPAGMIGSLISAKPDPRCPPPIDAPPLPAGMSHRPKKPNPFKIVT